MSKHPTRAENVADSILEKYWNGLFPVNVERILGSMTTVRGIPVIRQARNLGKLSCQVECRLEAGSPMFHYLINAQESWHRQRFSQAVALGHLVLGHLEQPGDTISHETFHGGSRQSDEAIDFAFNLLMPSGHAKQVALRTACMDKLSLAFDVSPTTVRHRLVSLGLLPEIQSSYLPKPKRLLSIF